jgi:hypothetical protein
MITLTYDCACGKENFVNLGTSHKDVKDLNVHRIVCPSCGKIHEVGTDDMSLRDKSQAEIDANMPVSTIGWM